MTALRRAGMLAMVALCACANTTDAFLGYDVPFPPPNDSAAAGEAAPEPLPAAPTDAAMIADTPSTAADSGPPPAPTCAPTTGDCDGDPANGCEIDLGGDPEHCGACGNACPGEDCACIGGVPTVVCRPGFADCDGDAQNGCEVDVDSDLQNCGGCARECHGRGNDVATAECVGGECHLTCNSTLIGDCDGNADNGCETALWIDNMNCGACGVRCTCNVGVCM